MEVRIATPAEIAKVSQLSVRHGNIPIFADQSIVALLEDEEKQIVGFAAVQHAMHAAGSWVADKHRRQGKSYELRRALDAELRRRGYSVYFAIPNHEFEKHLFAKYGAVTEQTVQVRHL
jgi:GNAT superfamily N-acetyltransferase